MRIAHSFRQSWVAPDGYRAILSVGLPLVLSMFSTSVMLFVDRLFLSLYSLDAIAAVMPAALAAISLLFFFMGTAGYTTVIVAQYMGSNAPHRVGPALWQGIWLAGVSSLVMAALSFAGEPLFAYAGHDPSVQKLEVVYFQTLCLGSFPMLLNNVLGCFYTGRGQTRMVLLANLLATACKIPGDYILIFGIPGILPPQGVFGAALSSVVSTSASSLFLAWSIFSSQHEKNFGTRSGWRPQADMLRRLTRFGLPSGFNLFTDNLAIFWFVMEVGSLGKVPLAATNIAFSLNGFIFTPMLGMNLAVASLVGQAMGSGNTTAVVNLTRRSLFLALAYMIPCALIMAVFAGPLVSLYASSDLAPELFALVREAGILLIYFVSLYSLVDAGSIIYFGSLKGAGDTRGVLWVLLTGIVAFLVVPVVALKHLGMQSVISYWVVLTAYVVFLAFGAMARFWQGRWKTIRVVETAPLVV